MKLPNVAETSTTVDGSFPSYSSRLSRPTMRKNNARVILEHAFFLETFTIIILERLAKTTTDAWRMPYLFLIRRVR